MDIGRKTDGRQESNNNNDVLISGGINDENSSNEFITEELVRTTTVLDTQDAEKSYTKEERESLIKVSGENCISFTAVETIINTVQTSSNKDIIQQMETRLLASRNWKTSYESRSIIGIDSV